VELGRYGPTEVVLGYWVTAASAVGTSLRAFTFSHVRRLDRICGKLLASASSAARTGATHGLAAVR
jgi:hypothetical protein